MFLRDGDLGIKFTTLVTMNDIERAQRQKIFNARN